MAFQISPVLKIRDFRFLFFARFFVSMALQVQAVIVGWQVYQIRPDALLLGLIGLTEAIPAISCSFISGHIVDIKRPASVYLVSLGVIFLNTCFLWLAVAPSLGLSSTQRLGILFVGIFISGAARSFASPAVFSLIPQIVPTDLIAPAAAWNSSSYQFAAIAGPAIGGLVYGFFGARSAFFLPIILVLFSLLSQQMLSLHTKQLLSTHPREPFFKSIRTGIRFAFGHKVLLSSMTLDMFSVLFGGAVAVLPIFADQVFHVGPSGLGILRAAPSIGSVVVALIIAIRPMKYISGTRLLWVVAGFGLSTIGFALSSNFILALIFLMLSGAFDGASMVIRSTFLQLLTPANMRGRVSSLSSVFITSSNEIGAFESGFAAKVFGLVPSVIIGGVMTTLVVVLTVCLAPELAKTRLDGGVKAK